MKVNVTLHITFNNFAKFYLVASVYALGRVGGGAAYLMAIKLLLLMALGSIILFPIFTIAIYTMCKIGLYFNPDFGCQGDAKAIVDAIEADLKHFKNVMMSLCPHQTKRPKRRKKK